MSLSRLMWKIYITTKQFMQDIISLTNSIYKTIDVYYQKNVKKYVFGRCTSYFLEFYCKSVVGLPSSFYLPYTAYGVEMLAPSLPAQAIPQV